MADQTIELVTKRAKEKMGDDIDAAEHYWNATCDELAKEMTDQGLNNTAQAIVALKVNHQQ